MTPDELRMDGRSPAPVDAGSGAPAPIESGPAGRTPFVRIDWGQFEAAIAAQNPTRPIRWWVIPLAILLSAAQAILCVYFENSGGVYLVATQISIIAFVFLLLLTLAANPVLRWTRLVEPLTHAEMMALGAALFVSAGIASFGLADQLIPMIAAPFNPNWATPQSGWNTTLTPYLNPHLYLTDPAVIQQFRQGFDVSEGSVWTHIPWSAWARPLGLWLIFVLGMYALLYGLALFFHRSWSNREKLIFPLAQLPEDALRPRSGGLVNQTLRSRVFWIGFLAVFLLLGYNGVCQAGWLHGMTPLNLGLDQNQLVSMLSDSAFRGVSDGGRTYLMFLLIFTAIGIGYLLPLEISCSLWSYHLLALGMILLGIWTAAFSSARVLTAGLLVDANFLTSLGGGALLAYATLLALKELLTPEEDRAAGFPLWRRLRTRGPAVLLPAAVVLGWMVWSGAPIIWSAVMLAFIALISIGMMRIVAETGIYWFQTMGGGPTHLANLLPARALDGAILAPLVPAYALFFFDPKTHIAPAIMNSLEMRQRAHADRFRFHLAVALALLTATVVSCAALLYVAYSMGANRATDWFFTNGPRSLFHTTNQLISGVTHNDQSYNGWFCLLGAAWVILSLWMRKRFFWWLHPIGLIMLISPLMTQLWFSFFLGWVCKKITVKYGGRHTFAQLRPLFIGLIFGELMACFVWAVLRQWLELPYVHIDINRYHP